jgi:hypothetical protein
MKPIPPTPDQSLQTSSITPLEEFDAKLKMTNAFCDTAKSYIQISSAALALPLLFAEAIAGKESVEHNGLHFHKTGFLYGAWFCFLVSIAFGLFYQWGAIRRVWDDFHNTYRTPQNASRPGYRRSWWVVSFAGLNLSGAWAMMTGSFYLGALLFTIFAAVNLWN